MTPKFDRNGLQTFIDGGEKSPPPIFAGRRRLLEEIEKAGRLVWQGAGAKAHGIPGKTQIIQGAPGAGKSSILAELQARSLAALNNPRDNHQVIPRILVLPARMLSASSSRALTAIATAGGMENRQWLQSIKSHIDNISVGFSGLALTISIDDADHLPDIDALVARSPPAKWRSPVIIAIDETQRLGDSTQVPHAQILQAVHDADCGLPLVLLLAGLGDAQAHAHAMGLTRGNTVHPVECLEPKEVESLIRDFPRNFGVNPSGYEDQLMSLAEPCEGWPRHLNFALRALSEQLIQTMGNLSRIDWDQAQQEAQDGRLRYYQSQQSPALRESEGLTSAILKGIGDSMKRSQIAQLIRDNQGVKPGYDLPMGMTEQSFLAHLIHQGALQERMDGTFHCPIPSFRRFLIEAVS